MVTTSLWGGGRRRAGLSTWLSSGLVGVLLLALVGFPFAALLAQTAQLGLGAWLETVSTAAVRQALVNTILVSACATVLAVGLGGGLALLLHQLHAAVPGQLALRVALLLPILIPPYVGAFGWVQAYGPAGLLDHAFGWELPGLFGPVGVTLLLAAHGLPLAFPTCAAALGARGASELERAARASGASAWTTARTVTLPLLRPALAASAGLVFLASASDFGIPATVGIPGRFQTVTTQIYRALAFASSGASFAAAVVLATCLILLALLALGLIARLGMGAEVDTSRGGEGRIAGGRSAWGGLVGAVAWLYVLLVSGLPLVALVLVALTRAYGLPQVPSNWSLVHFGVLFDAQRGPAFAHSLLLALGAASGTLLLGGLVAALPSPRLRQWLGTSVAVPYAVPGSTVAVAMILAFSQWWYGTLTIILVAYLARFWALAERPIRGALAQVGHDGLRAARSAGAGPLRAAWTVLVPALRPTLATVWVLVFVSAFHELTVSSLLYGPRSETVAVVVLDLEQSGDVAATAALGVLLTLIALLVALPAAFSPRAARLVGLVS